MKKYLSILSVAILFLASCASHKNVVKTEDVPVVVTTTDNNVDKLKKEYIQKVLKNATDATNIVSKIDFSLAAFGKDVSVDGKIYMRKNEVIRIVLAPLGLMEVGRLEFTPSHVLIMDRMHKEYVKATYNDLDFLKANGLDFYALQSLFWNELFMPGTKSLSEDVMKKFDADMTASTDRKVSFESGKLNYMWKTDPKLARINAATVNYATGTTQASSAQWVYDKFTALGAKQFPLNQTLSFQSRSLKSGPMKLDIKMKKISTDSDWDSQTSISSKYKEIKAEDILKKLVNF